MDIKSAFRLMIINPGDFDLLGFKFEGNYYIDKCLPMGCAISCNLFEKISTFLQWELKRRIATVKKKINFGCLWFRWVCSADARVPGLVWIHCCSLSTRKYNGSLYKHNFSRFRNRHLRHGCKNPTRKNTAINFTSNIKFDQKISPASRNSEYCWELKNF